MSKKAPTPLSIPSMPRKGQAAPAIGSFDDLAPAIDAVEPAHRRLSSRVQATIAVTVRLDEHRYERMKGWGSSRRITNQEIIVAALDGLFDLTDAERENAIAAARR